MPLSVPTLQRAWIVHRQGPPKIALSLREDWPVPSKLGPEEVLVKIHAAALNPVGHKLMRLLPNWAHSGRPMPAEHDLAGEIVSSNSTEFHPGDQVFGWLDVRKRVHRVCQGALAQYVRMPAEYLVPRTPNITPTQAAGIALAAQTAYQALVDEGEVKAGQTVLINGGSSAVGTFAIQLAKAKGARIVATASGRNEMFVRNLGADEFIDYTKAPLHEYLAANPPSSKFDIILDAVALIDPSLFTHSPAYLAPSGIFISTGPMPNNMSTFQVFLSLKTVFRVFLHPTWLGGTKRKYKITLLKNRKANLQAVQKLVADGSLKPVVDSVYDFKDVLKAYDRILSNRATGKVVVKVEPNVD